MLATASLAGAALLPTTASGGARLARSRTVLLRDSTFVPGNVTINRGDSVTWVWRDGGILHNVIAHSFRSHTKTRGSFTHRFTHSGTFKYRCTVHPLMVGKVVVR